MLKADWPVVMAAARVLMLVTLADIIWRGTCVPAQAQSQDPVPIIRTGGTVTVVQPLEQPIVLQSMMNSSVSNLVYKIPHFKLVRAAWTYINRDTPFVLSRDFAISSEVQPPTVADFAMITNKLVLDNATLTFKNLVLTNSRETDLFGIDWVFNSAGSMVIVQNVTFIDELCAATPAEVLQAAQSLPALPGYPPNQVSILPGRYCLPQFPGVPSDSPASSGQLCVDQAVHFTSLHLMSNVTHDVTGQRQPGPLIVMQNVTSLCLAFVSPDCLQQHNKTYCWKLQAAHLAGLGEYFSTADSNDSQQPRRLSAGATAGIVVACVAATAIVGAALAFFGMLRCRRRRLSDAFLGAGSTPGGTQDGSAYHWSRPKNGEALGSGDLQEVVIDNSPAGVVHAGRLLDQSSSMSSKGDKVQNPAGANGQSSAKQHKDITLGILLGAGSFGRVYKGRWQGNEVAIKVIHCRPRDLNRVLREAEILMSVQHANIVRCFKCCVVRPHQQGQRAAVGLEPADSALLQDPGLGAHQGLGSNSGAGAGSGSRHGTCLSGAAVLSPSEVPSCGSRQGAGTPTVVSSSAASAAGAAPGSGEAGVLGGQHCIDLQEVGSTDSFDEEAARPAQGQPEVQVWLVLELCGGGNLQDSNCKPKTRFDMARLVCRLEEVALGMEYLHSKGIMHSDLKAANVLLTNTIYGSYGQAAKLSDFGMANMLMDGATHRSTERMGTITHQAPEVLERGHLSPAADVYSFGIMMWELFTGTTAFKHLHYGAVVQRVVVKGQRPPIPPNAPEEYCLLMTRCWDASPHLRPTFKQIAECLRIMLEDQESGALDLQPQVLAMSQPHLKSNSDHAHMEPGAATGAAHFGIGASGPAEPLGCLPEAHAAADNTSRFSRPAGVAGGADDTPAGWGVGTCCHSSTVSDGGPLSGSVTVLRGNSLAGSAAGMQNGASAGCWSPAGSGLVSAGLVASAGGVSTAGGTSAAQVVQLGGQQHSQQRPLSQLSNLQQIMQSSHVQDL